MTIRLKHSIARTLTARRAGALAISIALLGLAFWWVGPLLAFERFVKFSPLVLAAILSLLGANLFVVALRFWRVLAHFGISVPWSMASRATLAGHVAGLFVISLFGQVAGRQSILRDVGVTPAVNASLAAYERALLAGVSGILASLGMAYLIGQDELAQFLGKLSLSEVLVASSCGLLLSLAIGRGPFETRILSKLRSWRNVFRLGEIIALTLAGQAIVLASFMVAALSFAPHIRLMDIFAAAAIISFAASMPITVNGWGVREVTAVFVLGKLGFSPADAMAVSIVVGICSTLVIVLVAPFSLLGKPGLRRQHDKPLQHPVAELEKGAAWVMGMGTAVTIFFQAHITLSGGTVNLNLADPFAILSFAAVMLHLLFSKEAPSWKVGRFNAALVAISAALLIGFVRGYLEVGVTQWALGGRLLGWVVLLGYLSAGYLIVRYAGSHGLRRLAETLAAVASVIVIQQIIVRVLAHWGLDLGIAIPPTFDGYSGNRNAFTLQLLCVAALLIGNSTIYARGARMVGRDDPAYGPWFLLGSVLAGLVLAASRAGWGVIFLMLCVAWYWRIADRRFLLKGILIAAVLSVAFLVAGTGTLGHLSASGSGGQMEQWLGLVNMAHNPKGGAAGDGSDLERWALLKRAFDLWWQSPLLGAGLGVFIVKSQSWLGYPMVVHNTLLWILAEFGLLGILAFCSPFVILVRYLITLVRPKPSDSSLTLLLIAFGMFGLVHEVFYQRIFWLELGALAALPFAKGRLNRIH